MVGNIFKQNWILSQNILSGSLIYLNNPGMIIIQFSNFTSNRGILGGCIYFNEISNQSILLMISNNFTNNSAFLSGGVIFLNTKIDQINWTSNYYLNNHAVNYGNIVATNPFRAKLKNKKTLQIKNKSLFKLLIVPGSFIENLEFDILDFFGEKMKNYKSGSASITLKHNTIWAKEIDSSLKIDGKVVVSISNGNFVFKF